MILSLIVPVFIPLVHFQDGSAVGELVSNQGMNWIMVFTNVLSESNPVSVIPDFKESVEPLIRYDLGRIIVWIYFGGLLFFLIRMIYSYYRVVNLISGSERRRILKMILVITSKKVSPFSLFKWLVIPNNKENHPDLDKIIRHEMIHYQQKHSIDILMSELLIAFQWFNPFAWLLKSAVIKNNEFLVDQKLITDSIDYKAYQYALLNTSLGDQKPAMVNSFNNGLIKKRIEMMNKKKTPIANRIKNILLIPFAFILILAFSAYSNTASDNIQGQDRKIVKKDSTNSHVKIIVDGKELKLKDLSEVTEEGGAIKIIKMDEIEDLGDNISGEKLLNKLKKYNNDGSNAILLVKESKKDGKSVDVYVGAMISGKSDSGGEGIIYLNKDGEDIHLYSAEGKCKTLYVTDSDGQKANILIRTDGKDGEYLIIIDDKVVDEDALKNLDGDKIECITILRDEKALKEYGDKAKDGVLKIKTKK